MAYLWVHITVFLDWDMMMDLFQQLKFNLLIKSVLNYLNFVARLMPRFYVA